MFWQRQTSEVWEELLPPGRSEGDLSIPGYTLESAECCKSSRSKRPLFLQAVRYLFWGLLAVFGFFKLLDSAQRADAAFFREHGTVAHDSFEALENKFPIISHWRHDTIPTTCYSHNNRGRPISLHSAISSGCMSIEMTLFPAGHLLLIGPNPNMLSRVTNLQDLYIDPLLGMIREYETDLSALYPSLREEQAIGGFSGNSREPLVLLMDFGADPERSWSQLIPHIEPLREAGILTRFNGSGVVHGHVTIVATGNVPFHRILEMGTFRDVFFDAPLLELMPSSNKVSGNSDYNSRNSYCASADFRKAIGNVNPTGFSDKQLADIREQVQTAHGLGLEVRYVNTPNWSHKLRSYVRRILTREGVDMLSVDESITPRQRGLGTN